MMTPKVEAAAAAVAAHKGIVRKRKNCIQMKKGASGALCFMDQHAEISRRKDTAIGRLSAIGTQGPTRLNRVVLIIIEIHVIVV